ncbi:hypothetical protein BX666DRAFT_1862426 [Dichotomocladium elegans]|nr:hypothetical protein BX666DRAFT_1862426 [Dichotomocladium elegans]
MPPNPEVPVIPTRRRFSQYHVPQGVYLGLDVEIQEEEQKAKYAISVHDGTYTSDYYSGEFAITNTESKEEAINEGLRTLVDIIKRFSFAQHYKIHIIAISSDVADSLSVESPSKLEQSAGSMFWRELDAIPIHAHTHGQTADERASAAVRKAVMWMSPQFPGNIPLDFNGMIHMCELSDYEKTVNAETWRVLNEMVNEYKERKLHVSFFNSTPQGGGVALMRHALIRLYRLMGVDVHCKFQLFIDWSNENVERFWLGENGPIETSDVIVIDDPQGKTRIIFRSHIEIRADLIRDDPDGPQAETWNFLWQFIQHADIFIAHPINNFIPDVVPRKNVVLLPAATDPLDGLNKPLDRWCTDYYQSVFNRVCIDQGANEVDWSRPYIVQVARFDPSKGIPDVLESYRLLRERLAAEGVDDFNTPQLVICGHGSIDDPDGTIIYEQTHQTLEKPEFAAITLDIIAARLPPSDQLLDLIISNATVALQLSHREGFEVKVTEALHQGVPVVAYQAGGIPLQIKADEAGFLVPIGDVEAVADRLYSLVTDSELRSTMSAQAKESVTEEFFTIWNSMSWLHLFLEMTNEVGLASTSDGLLDEDATHERNSGMGNESKVCDLWKEKYHYSP